LDSGIVETLEAGIDRVKSSDSLNAEEVILKSNYKGIDTYIIDV